MLYVNYNIELIINRFFERRFLDLLEKYIWYIRVNGVEFFLGLVLCL